MTAEEPKPSAETASGAEGYTLLSKSDAETVQNMLAAVHGYFYHFTLDSHLDSIETFGLDPAFEGEDSRYNRTREPAKALRYCTRSFLAIGLSAANTRNQYWDERRELWLPKTSNVVLIRTPAASVLGRSCGLDHSFSNADLEVTRILGDSRTELTADEFIGVVTKFGAISCYQAIPASELEVCLEPQEFCRTGVGTFSKLV